MEKINDLIDEMTERLEVMESKLELSSGSFSKINNGVTSLRQSIINLQENTKNTTVSLSAKMMRIQENLLTQTGVSQATLIKLNEQVKFIDNIADDLMVKIRLHSSTFQENINNIEQKN